MLSAQTPIPIELIPAFLLLAEELNISRAARRLKVSQPALTRKLRTLESNLGVQLFLRQSRGLALTATGKDLKRNLAPVFDSISSVFATLKESQSTLQGQIVFGCFSELGNHLIVPLLLKFIQRHPDVSLDVRLISEAEILTGVAEGHIHLGVANKAPDLESIRSYKLVSERIQLFTSTNNPDIDKNANPKFVGFKSQDRLLNSLLKKIFPSTRPFSPTISFSVNSHAAMIKAARELNLYGALPRHSLTAALKSGDIRIASTKELINEIHLVMPNSEFPERKLIELNKFIKTQLKAGEGEEK